MIAIPGRILESNGELDDLVVKILQIAQEDTIRIGVSNHAHSVMNGSCESGSLNKQAKKGTEYK